MLMQKEMPVVSTGFTSKVSAVSRVGVTDEEKLRKVDKAYDSPPWWYDVRGFMILTFSYRSSLFQQIRFFSNNMGKDHLEVAVGTGTLLSYILKWRKVKGSPKSSIEAFDYAESMLNGAKHRFSSNPDVILTKRDAADLDFRDDSFDTANIANAVHCIPEMDAALRETRRVLKPGGTLALNVQLEPRGFFPSRWLAKKICTWGIRKGILYSTYEQADFRARLERAGFEITKEDVTGNTYSVLAKKPV